MRSPHISPIPANARGAVGDLSTSWLRINSSNSAVSLKLIGSIASLIVQIMDEDCPPLRLAGAWVAEDLFFIEKSAAVADLKKKGRFATESAETQQNFGKLEIEFSVNE